MATTHNNIYIEYTIHNKKAVPHIRHPIYEYSCTQNKLKKQNTIYMYIELIQKTKHIIHKKANNPFISKHIIHIQNIYSKIA
jgi:hypothetical protein